MILAPLLAAFGFARILAAEPQAPAFLVDDGMQFTFPIPGAAGEGLSILLSAQSDVLTNVKLQVREFKDPDGRNRDPAILHAPDVVGDVSPDGKRITLRPEAASFRLAGDYRVSLSLQGTSASEKVPVKAIVKFVIHRPAPDCNLDEVKDQTITLTRWSPWNTASGTGTVPLRETSGKGAISDLVATGRPLLRLSDRAQVPGTVTAKVAANTIDPGGDGPVTLTFADVAWAGNFVTQVSLASPSFPTGKSVPLKVSVRDALGWPLFAIALGVFGGFAAQFAAQTLRPRRENTYQITGLRADLVRYRGLVRKTNKIARLAALTDRLRAAEDQNTFGQASNAKALIEQVVQDLATFLKAEDTAREKVETDIKTLKAQIQKYCEQRGREATPEETKFFAASEGALRDIQGAFLGGQLDLASDLLDELSESFAGIKRQQFQKSLEILGERIEALTVADDRKQEKRDVRKKYLTACLQCASGKEDEARATAADAEIDLRELEAELRGLAGRGVAGMLSGVSFTLEVAAPPSALTRLLATDDIEVRTTDTALGFQIVDDEHRLRPDDKFEWHFGDGGPFTPGDRTASHHFEEQGLYRVKVRVRRGDAVAFELAVDITVLPGRVQRKLGRLRDNIRQIDVFLFLVALVLACLTGLLYLYVDKAFGTVSDYSLAVLWGFGIDNSVRGFAPVLAKLTGSMGS